MVSIYGIKPYAIEIVGYSVRVGQRAATAYVDHSLSMGESFIFRNCFNVLDVATLPCVTTSKTDVDRSTAVVNGTSSFYDQKVEQTFEVECEPLTRSPTPSSSLGTTPTTGLTSSCRHRRAFSNPRTPYPSADGKVNPHIHRSPYS